MQQVQTPERTAPKPQGFTILELIVAMVVFGVAFLGMFPLLAVLSRNMMPLRDTSSPYSYTYFTPSRDWESEDTNQTNHRHTFYLLPFNEPWARKLGASARILVSNTENDATFAAYSPTSIEPTMISRDDDTDTTDTDSDGVEDYAETSTDNNWQSGTTSYSDDRQDYRFHESLVNSSSSAAATWSVLISTPGWYSVQATWPTSTGKSLTSVNYHLSGTATGNLSTAQCSCDVSQASPTNSVGDTTGTWFNITPTAVYLGAGLLQVTLNVPVMGDTTYSILADGMRVVQNIPSINDSGLTRTPNDDTETVQTQVTVKVRIPQ